MIGRPELYYGAALLIAPLGVALWPAPPRPRDELLAVVGFCALGAGLGARLFWSAVRAAQGEVALAWGALYDPFGGGLSSVGAILGGALVLWLIYRKDVLVRLAILDFFAPLALLSLSVARLGCAARGCDFGRVYSGERLAAFMARYSSPSAPAWEHFAATGELLAEGATPPLWPMTLALSVGAALTALVVTRVTRFKRPGVRAAALVIAYAALRATLESTLRHPAAGAHLHGLNLNALASALAALLAASWWILSARLALKQRALM